MRYHKRINPARLVFINETRGPAPTAAIRFLPLAPKSPPTAGTLGPIRPSKGLLTKPGGFLVGRRRPGAPVLGRSGCVALP